jgi:hypothetical protein
VSSKNKFAQCTRAGCYLIIVPTIDSWVSKHLTLHDGIVGNMLMLAMIDTFLIGVDKD